MRELTAHKVNGVNDGLTVLAVDGPGPGGANHHYRVEWNPNGQACDALDVRFHHGPIKEAGVNGVTQEVLLAIIEDRLMGFQSGPFACTDNAEALEHIRKAQEVLQRRTKARLARGVEGTMTV